MVEPITNGTDKKKNFICGVVEGFYGRPWTTEQRKDLFQKLKKWGMDSYLYAPKDDYKHRAFWRELYSVEEAEHLTGLISAAKECGITFYYALSPGLDITYSSAKEIAILKRKLEQVSQFGCNAFALLFDDIEPEMSEADKEVFQSFAHAQVSVTNEIFQHLNQPMFMVCPTQYCSARAAPNVQNSEYLNTLGSKLAPEVDIMWTGTRVISRLLTSECIEEITEVLKRPPVIWDNIHANDYDQKRVFLGPYQGRSPDVIRKLRGVMTNPNCEYGANFVAIHTLAQWSKCNVDGTSDLILNESVSADIRLETETEDGISEDVPPMLPENIYHPKRALKNAILDWLGEFKRYKQAWGPIIKPQPVVTMAIPVPIIPSINTCMSLTTTTQSTTTVTTVGFNNLQALAEVNSSLLQPTSSSVVMNSLAVESKVISEPMECNISPSDSPQPFHKDGNTIDVPMSENASNDNSPAPSSIELASPPTFNGNDDKKIATADGSDAGSVDAGNSISGSNVMLVDSAPPNEINDIAKEHELQYEDVALMCDLFYLPFEHGSQSVQLLQEFNWLKSNAHVVAASNLRRHTRSSPGEDGPEVQEWRERSKKLVEISQSVNRLFDRLTYCNNRELVYDLYPYVWDMRGVISLLCSYIKWLGYGHFESNVGNYTHSSYTWFSKGWKENFMSGEQEPWVFRGGLTADLQRLIPVDCGSDLFIYKAPDIPTNKIYTIRPYLITDEQEVYKICRKTCLDGTDGSEIFSEYPDLPCERIVGAFCCISPEFSFVVEDETGIVGYALAALNAKDFYAKLKISWIPEMQLKYPLKEGDDESEEKSASMEMIKEFHRWQADDLPESILGQHPSVMCATVLNSVSDQSVVKRLVVCLLAALRANGSFGVYVPINVNYRYFIEFYGKLGFVELSHEKTDAENDMVYMGRMF